MARGPRNSSSIYDAPSYSIAEAARLIGVPRTTLGAWVNGRVTLPRLDVVRFKV
ncbi:MAG: helix-turn-helix transcriptional regulator [Polyangiaceae bacterium]|nr:helix-turn-helix transcriptional regulator [Myxococcales bacterium]MCB9587931.1 helix-turn-helix transcriptional regulator [Polyangiaceae bacterium]